MVATASVSSHWPLSWAETDFPRPRLALSPRRGQSCLHDKRSIDTGSRSARVETDTAATAWRRSHWKTVPCMYERCICKLDQARIHVVPRSLARLSSQHVRECCAQLRARVDKPGMRCGRVHVGALVPSLSCMYLPVLHAPDYRRSSCNVDQHVCNTPRWNLHHGQLATDATRASH